MLDTLRSQIECDEMSLHGHLFTVFLVSHTRHELMYAIASMSEIWGMGIYDVIVLTCWKMPPHIWELVIRLQRGERTLSPTLGSGAGGCVLGTTL